MKTLAGKMAVALVGVSLSWGCNSPSAPSAQVTSNGLLATRVAATPGVQKHLVLLQTNDIHGGIEPVTQSDGGKVGGVAIFGGIAEATRAGVKAKYGQNGAVLVLDDGDQFQGTLISNYNEGQLLFNAMAAVGYDAAITGNHDYDFGPIGWLDDVVTPSNPDKDPRGALMKLLSTAVFPLISANTYFKSSFVDIAGNALAVDGKSCEPVTSSSTKAGAPVVDWSKAETPPFLKPYLIKNVAGLRVALIGIDNFDTSEITTIPDVADLCFGDEASSYLRMRAQLDGQADVFIMILHDGDATGSPDLTNLMTTLAAAKSPGKGAVVDAILAGHTHYVNNVTVAGIHGIQSGANGKMFGRIDLVWDVNSGKIDTTQSKAYAGVQMYYNQCDTGAADICQVDPATHAVSYEGVPVTPLASVDQMVAAERAIIAPMANAEVGTATTVLNVDRTAESPLADLLTDLLREISGADVAMMNTGGIRSSLGPGTVTYEDFFRVLPFNNHGVIVSPMSAATLLALLTRSAQTCGDFGALMQSGLKVTLTKNCSPNGTAIGTDYQAKVLHVETLSGEVLLDTATGVQPAPGRVFQVATLDFLAEGGSGFTQFEGVPEIKDMGNEREIMTQVLEKAPRQFSSQMDNRWVQQGTPAGSGN